ncbi:hypothetical protein [Robertmurraya sp. FSL R5-0851]
MNENKNQQNLSVTNDNQELQNKKDMNSDQNISAQKDGFRYDYDDSSDV